MCWFNVCAIFRLENTYHDMEIPSWSDQNHQYKLYFGPKYLNYGSVYEYHFHCKNIGNICTFKRVQETCALICTGVYL